MAVERPKEWRHARNLGRLALGLHVDSHWVARRVETLHLLSATQLERRVILDIDSAYLRSMAARSRAV